MECNKNEAKRAMDVAERKVKENDYNGAKRFANKAQNLFPDLGGLKQLLTAIDVYISAEKQICREADWYGILGVDPTANDEAMKKQYHNLLLMLHPDKNNSDDAKGAYDLVSKAWYQLSDETRRTSYDKKRSQEVQKIVPTTQNTPSQHRPTSSRSTPHVVYEPVVLKPHVRTNIFSMGSPSSMMPRENINFWTKCGICRTIFQYPRVYRNQHLLCLTCNHGFIALEIPPPPPSTVPKPSRKSPKNEASRKKSTGPSSSTRREPAAPPSVNHIFQWDFSSGTAGSSSGNATNQAENVVQQAPVKRKRGESQEKDTAIKRSKKDESHMHGQISARNVACGNTETPNNLGGSFRRHPHVQEMFLPADVVDKVLMERGQSEILKRLPKMITELEAKVRVTEEKKKRMKAAINMSGKNDKVKRSVDKVKTNDEVVVRSAKVVEKNDEVVRSAERNDEVVRSAEEVKTDDEVVISAEKNDEVVRSVEEVKTDDEVVRSAETNDEFVRSAEKIKKNDEVVRSAETNGEVVRSAEEVKTYDEVVRSAETNDDVVRSAEEMKTNDEVVRSTETNGEVVRSAEEEKTNDEIVRSAETNDEVERSAEKVKINDEIVRSAETNDEVVRSAETNCEVVISAEEVMANEVQRTEEVMANEVQRTEEVTTNEVERSVEEVKTIIVPDSDFHNFDLDRTDLAFKEDQIWAAYDNDDGMPRFYACIEKVITLEPFKMYISWLNSKSTFGIKTCGHIDWIGSGFIKTCGEFTSGRFEATNTKSPFSHKVEFTQDEIRGLYYVLPKTGQVWALYRNWSLEWDKNTPDEVKHKYEIVQVLDDYTEDKQSVSVALLIKAEGFKTVFRRSIDGNNVREIPKEEMLRFSHHVPHYILTGKEADNAPEGYLELDPAATPLEFFAEEADGNRKSEADNAPENFLELEPAAALLEFFSEEAHGNERSEAVQEESYVPEEIMDMDLDEWFEL
ncbi:PREDICTED: uncharacterized protein LOC104761327 [Camelina sativa]|uniref:Uncharacterized protein LOC104761327 n=1 Tax=Camelina sativa TaxID=90675 RepID=A0ABM0X9J8_CAMSA|nr:PREDICTED: uncharacterized protein LOC104761327 [Camelina sativa]